MNDEPEIEPARSLTSRAMSGMFWSLSQNAFAAVAAFAAVLVLARLLSPSDFGVVAMAWAIISILVVISDFGLTPALVRKQRPSQLMTNTAFWMHLTASVTLALLVVCAGALWIRFGDSDQLALITMSLAVVLPLGSLRLIPFAALSQAMKFRSIAMRQVIAQTAGIAVAVPVALNGFGPWALVAQYVVFAAVEVIVLTFVFPWRVRSEFSVPDAKELISFGLPAVFNRLVIAAREHGTSIIIGVGLGSFALGLWSISMQIASLVASSVNNAINAVALPSFSKVSMDRERLIRGFSRTVGMSAILVVPVLIGVAAVSETAVPLVFGETWSEAAPIANLVALGFAISAVQWIDLNLWWSMGRPKIELGLSVLSLVLTIVLLLLLMPFGLVGIASVILLRSLLIYPIRIYLLRKYAGVPLSVYRPVAGAFLAGGLMYAVVVFGVQEVSTSLEVTQWLSLALQVGMGAICYFLVSLVIQRSQLLNLVETFRGNSVSMRDSVGQ